jgi:hypothetical protein
MTADVLIAAVCVLAAAAFPAAVYLDAHTRPPKWTVRHNFWWLYGTAWAWAWIAWRGIHPPRRPRRATRGLPAEDVKTIAWVHALRTEHHPRQGWLQLVTASTVWRHLAHQLEAQLTRPWEDGTGTFTAITKETSQP